MTTFYVDTSALAKRYVTEPGSVWLRQLLSPLAGHTIVICDLTSIEFFAMLARHRREGTLSQTNAVILQNGFLNHYQNEYLSIPLEGTVLLTARQLVSNYLLRPPDALQLASAQFVIRELGEPLTFICADHDLLTVAQAEGLTVDDPNAHP